MKKIGLIALISAIGAVIVAGGALLYTNTWNPSWNPFFGPQESWEKVFPEVVKSMEGLQSYHNNFDFSFKVEGPLKSGPENKKAQDKNNVEYLNLRFGGNTDIDIRDKNSQKSKGTFSITMASLGDENENENFSTNIDFIGTSPKELFFKINNIDISGKNSQDIALVASLFETNKGKWISYKEDDLKEILGKDWEKISEEISKSTEVGNVSSTIANTNDFARRIIADKNLVSFKKNLKSEKVNGKRTFHYLLSLNKQEAKKVILDFIKDVGKSQSLPVSQAQLDRSRERLDKFFNALGEIDFEIWIGAKDKMVYKFKLDKEISFDKLLDFAKEADIPMTGEEPSNAKIIIGLEWNFSKFNEKFDIQPPKEYKSFFKDVVPEMVSLFIEEMTKNSTSTGFFNSNGNLLPGIEYNAKGELKGK